MIKLNYWQQQCKHCNTKYIGNHAITQTRAATIINKEINGMKMKEIYCVVQFNSTGEHHGGGGW